MKNLLKSILFLSILLILVEISIVVLMPKVDSSKYNIFEKGEYEVLHEKKGTIDVLAFGDSLIYSSINPLIVWNEYGYTMFDVAEPAYIMEDAFKQLKAAIDYHQPKVVIMEGNMLFRDPKKYPVYDKLAKKLTRLVPIEKYHNNWKKVFLKDEYNSTVYKGYKFIKITKPSKNYDYMEYTTNVRNFPDGNVEIFQKMLDYCNKKGVKLIVVSTPSQVSANVPRRTALIRLSKKLNFDYIDLNLGNPLDIDWTKETKDEGGHLNYLGAIKVSKYMGKYLKNSGLVKDHRGDDDYSSWDKAYQKYMDEYNATSLPNRNLSHNLRRELWID